MPINEPERTVTVQPSTPVDGGDGNAAHTSKAEKVAVNTWNPMAPLESVGGNEADTPATRVQNPNNNTADMF